MHFVGPLALANGRIRRELLVGQQPVQQVVRLAQAMRSITAPGIFLGPFDDSRPERVGFDVAQDRQQVVVTLDDRTFEPSLPDVAAGPMVLVVPLGVRNQQALHDPADRGAGQRAQEEVEVIVEQTVAVEPKRHALLEVRERLEKGGEIAGLLEHLLPVIAAIDHMIDQPRFNRPQRTWHSQRLVIPSLHSLQVKKTF